MAFLFLPIDNLGGSNFFDSDVGTVAEGIEPDERQRRQVHPTDDDDDEREHPNSGVAKLWVHDLGVMEPTQPRQSPIIVVVKRVVVQVISFQLELGSSIQNRWLKTSTIFTSRE